MTASLEDRADHWRVEDVVYRDGVYSVDLAKKLLPARTQDEHARHAREARQTNDFHAAEAPLYHSVFTTIFRNHDSQQQAIREQIRSRAFFNRWLMTLTKIIYTPTGQDTVIHNVGLPDQYEVNENITGPNEWLNWRSNTDKLYRALLGTEGISGIREVYMWIARKEYTYLWRLDHKSTNNDERVVGFYTDRQRVGLNCKGKLSYICASLGVRIMSVVGAQKISEE